MNGAYCIKQCDAKTFKYRTAGSSFVYIILQASSGREMDQNKELPAILYFNIFGWGHLNEYHYFD